jgi:hypothetical protein
MTKISDLQFSTIRVCEAPVLKMTACGTYVVLVGINVEEDEPELAAKLRPQEVAIYVSLDFLERDVARIKALMLEARDESV